MTSQPVIRNRRDLMKLTVGALGVVYGDIGTSPLYAVRECFTPPHGVEVTTANTLGVISLFFWALTLVVCVKYLTYIMRADNEGEGGIMALMALLLPEKLRERAASYTPVLFVLGIFGAALLYGDGIITPAISVLSAVEGLNVATPTFSPYIVPITITILIAMFWAQSRGTSKIGAVFGPLTALWFLFLIITGLPWIAKRPDVLLAVNPIYAVEFFLHHGSQGFWILSSVVLCITGAEALYADMGHFGRRSIKLAWYALVFPALLITYFGQGALLLMNEGNPVQNPFFELTGGGLYLYFMVGLATSAAVIASQAMISGAFSITNQAIQLGYLPRMKVVHTSGQTEGQIYVPQINLFLAILCIALVLGFRESSNLAAAYGIAVTGTMTITSILFYAVARRLWGWSRWKAGALLALFLSVDIAFLVSNFAKAAHGGWFPLLIGAALFVTMWTWKRGRDLVSKKLLSEAVALGDFVETVKAKNIHRVPGTAVFMTQNLGIAPSVLIHHFKHNQVLHKKVILLSVITEHTPTIAALERVRVTQLDEGFYQVTAKYGFLQTPNVPEILLACEYAGLKPDQNNLSFYLGRDTILSTRRGGMARWRKKLFFFMMSNSRPATAFFGIPPDRVVEIGAQIEL